MGSGQWIVESLDTFSEVEEDPIPVGTPPCFLYVWQRKDLREGLFVCVAGKGFTDSKKRDFGDFLGCVAGKGVKGRRSGEWRMTRKVERVGSG